MRLIKSCVPPAVSAIVLAALLTACGGGDDGPAGEGIGVPPGGPVPVTMPGAQNASGMTTSVPAPSYPRGSEELGAFDFLNTERGRCGFGLLAQNARLDAAARAHADYQLVNNLFTHFEDRVNFPSGFTGTTLTERYAFQQYANFGGGVDEIAGLSGTGDKSGFGVAGMRGLLNAPYHLKGLMSGMREMGVSVRSSSDTGTPSPRVILQWNGAFTQAAGPQNLPAADVRTYPCEGASDLARQLTNESPEPVPGRDLRTNPLGTSVYIAVRAGNTLAIDSVVLTDTRTGAPVALRSVVTAANDPQRSFRDNEAYVVADAPLAASTAYQVNVSGTNNGTAFTRTFTFTTGM